MDGEENETPLATAVRSLAAVTREIRDLLSEKLDDHHMVPEHETRISPLEERLPDRPRD
jgi:hypothetical protein